MSKEEIVKKICKCLALANSANPNEAAAALARAQSLMEKYGVTREDVDLSEIGSKTTEACKSKTLPGYIALLISLINRAFGCEVILHPDWSGWGWVNRVEFIGVNPRAEIAAYAFEVLKRQLVPGRQRFIAGLSKRMKRANKVKLANHWAEGWVIGASRRVVAITLSEGDRERIARWKQNRDYNLVKTAARFAKGAGQRVTLAYLSGRSKGENARIHPAATGDDQPAQIQHKA